MRITPIAVFTALLLTLFASSVHAFTPAHFWSQHFGGTASDYGNDVVVDGSGNIILTGYFSGTANFGGADLVGASTDAFLAKYRPDGTHLWSQNRGGTGGDFARSVTADGAGNILVAGDFTGTTNLGGGNLVSAGSFDIFIAKYSADGVHQWSQRFGSTGTDLGYTVATDAAGNVFLGGYFTGTADFGGGNLVSAGSNDAILAKYDANGVHQWSRRFGSTGFDVASAVATDAAGNVVVTGYFNGTVDFGGGNLVSAGSHDVFVAKFDATGVHQWSRRFGNTSFDLGLDVAVDGSNNVYATGYVIGTVDFGGGSVAGLGFDDAYLVKYDASGAHLWSQRFGGADNDRGSSVAVDALGNVFLTGYFRGTASFGGGGLVSAGDYDIFLATYDTDGTHRWSRRFGDSLVDVGNAVVPDESGNLVATGYYRGTVNFGGSDLVSTGNDDVFLAKFSGTAAEPIISSITDIGNDQGRQVRIRFSRSGYDDVQFPAVEQYEAFRRSDAAPAAANIPGSPRQPLAEGWEQVGVVDAHGESGYVMVVPTIGDSTEALGQYYSVFFVRAATGLSTTFYDSPVDSGYSVDNLAPGIPGSLVYNGGLLSWNESPAADFDYFTVYGANADDFGGAAVVDYTVVPQMDVTAAPYVYYYVTATDFSGNEGKPAKINTLTGVGGTPRGYVLSVSNYPNPFNPRTTVRYTVPSRGAVSIAIYDARGALVATLVNHEERDAGAYHRDWDGRRDDGTAVASGVYFARIEHAGATRSRKIVLLE